MTTEVFNANHRTQILSDAIKQRILLLDGAMGTMIQSYKLEESDYRGERFSDWNSDLLYTCTDAAGLKDAVLHTAAQLKQVYADGVIHKTTQLSKARALKGQLATLASNEGTTQADIDLVVW